MSVALAALFAFSLAAGQTQYTTPQTQDKTYASYPTQYFRCVFVVAADDDGSFRHTSDDGRSNRLETRDDCARIVTDINKAYAPAGIQLVFDDSSYVRRNSTALNRQFLSPLSGGPTPPDDVMQDRAKKPPTPRSEQYAKAKADLQAEFPGRVVFLFMSDSQWTWRDQSSRWEITTTSGGWSGPDAVCCICGTNSPVCIHEMGHHFGLDHTFGKRPNKAEFERMVSEAMASGQSFKEALAQFDGDGLPDTPPDPGSNVFANYRPFVEKPYAFRLKGKDGNVTNQYMAPAVQYNWMSYYPDHRERHPATGRIEGRFSRLQCMKMYQRASQIPWRPVFKAASSGDMNLVKQLTDQILVEHPDAAAQNYARIARGWLTPKLQQRPAQVADSNKDIYVSDCSETTISVGWGAPAFNRGPLDSNHSMFLTVGGHVFGKGIFAHADSSVVYELGGKWKRFTAQVGVLDHSRFEGSVRFLLFGDGRLLFSSQVLRATELVEINVDVTGVRDLNLQATDGGDGGNSDWAAWLNPRLIR